jgi:glycosyltransferase involved in cell wall biosynthesis
LKHQLRVLHITPALFGEGGVFGGGERYAFELARHMADQTPTRLVTFADTPTLKTVGKLDVRVLGPAWRVRRQLNNPFHLALFRHLAWADVVHCHQRSIVASSFSAAVCRAIGRKVFVSDLGGGGWDVSAHVIYGGIDTDLFSPDPGILKEPLVIFVGRLMPHKGVNYLIEALPEGMTLELIGRPYHDSFVADLKRSAVGKLVVFRLDCDDSELIRAYRRAACVVLPSVYRTVYGDETSVPELLGQTLLEGMSCGTPTVCTDVASMPEVVQDGKTGFVVPPNNPAALRMKLEWLRDHPEDVARLGQAGRRRILERFTWPSVVTKCLKAYASVHARDRG